MATIFELISGFFTGKKYRAKDFARSHKALITNGVLADDLETFQVVPSSGMTIAIKPGSGYCWIEGHYGNLEATATLTLTTADGVLNRIDRIVARLDMANGKITLNVLTGTTASVPTAPAITRDGTVYEICLAEIYIAKGTTAITSAMITDTRSDSTLCGGCLVRTADVMVLSGKADKADVGDKAALTTIAKDNLVNAINEIVTSIFSIGALASKIYDFSPLKSSKQFNASGNWTCPEGVTKIAVWIQNGGDGSSGVTAKGETNNNYWAIGAEGASGAWSLIHNIDVVPGTVYPIVIGAGGAAGIASTTTYSYTINPGGVGGISSAFGYNGNSSKLGQFQKQGDSGGLGGGAPSTKSAVLSGSMFDRYVQSGQTDGLRNGGAQVMVSGTQGNTDSVYKNGNPGTAGKVIIHY